MCAKEYIFVKMLSKWIKHDFATMRLNKKDNVWNRNTDFWTMKGPITIDFLEKRDMELNPGLPGH